MKAIILAAGRGSRMQGMTDDRPKCLVEFRGKPLVQHQIDALRAGGVSDIGIVCGYKQELLTAFGDQHFINSAWASTNMVSSLACAQSWLQNEACIVSYSDIFYDAEAVRSLIGSDWPLAITYDPNWLSVWQNRFADPLSDAETFQLSHDNRVTEIGNRPKTIDEVQGQYMGLLRISPTSWQNIEALRAELDRQTRDRLDMTGLLSRLIQRGYPVYGIPYLGEWGEIDNESDLLSYSTAK